MYVVRNADNRCRGVEVVKGVSLYLFLYDPSHKLVGTSSLDILFKYFVSYALIGWFNL